MLRSSTMTMMFAPLEMGAEKRSALYHAARLSMLHDRVLKRFDKVDDAADKALAAAELFAAIVRPAESRVTLGM
jgi:hypothetical protein